LVQVQPITVRPTVLFAGEISTTFYVEAILPSGTAYRVPVINSLLPNIRLRYHNGVLTGLEYLYENPAAKVFEGRAGDRVDYLNGHKIPAVTESVERSDHAGRRVHEIRNEYTSVLFVPGKTIPRQPQDLRVPVPPPDSTLKPPGDIEKNKP